MVGQFFTPEVVARAMFQMVDVQQGDRVIDPSCGDGVFLKCRPAECDMSACELDERCRGAVEKVAAEGMVTWGDALTQLQDRWGTFDVAIGNPPYSAQAHLERRKAVLAAYELGTGRPRQCLEVLFVELFVNLVKIGGRVAVILPDGPLSNGPYFYVREWLLRNTVVEAIISLPRSTFSNTQAKTNVLVARKVVPTLVENREPTWLRNCEDLAELTALDFAHPSEATGWTSVVLAETTDWRPEAHVDVVAQTEATVVLGELCLMRTGAAKYGALRELHEAPAAGRMLLLRAKNLASVGGLQLENSDLAYIRKDGLMFNENAVVEPGEILFVRVGVGCYGRTAVVPEGLEAQADDWIHVLTPLPELDGERLAEWMNGAEGRGQIRRMAKGVGTLSISKSALAELRIPASLLKQVKPKAGKSKSNKN